MNDEILLPNIAHLRYSFQSSASLEEHAMYRIEMCAYTSQSETSEQMALMCSSTFT
jgi:hypothetical protein